MFFLVLAPADAYALTMVGILAFALGSLVTMFLVMARNGQKDAELDLPEFPEESEPATKKPVTKKEKPAEPMQDWEKDADWWK